MTLVDLPAGIGLVPNEFLDLLAEAHGESRRPDHIATGVYQSHVNFGHELKARGILKTEYPFSDYAAPRGVDMPFDYGVCDNYHQIIARWWKKLEDSDRRFVITIAPMRKDEQPEEGGWRWHKWGPYIGTLKPQHEYLHDENDSIQVVYCFHIYELVEDSR